MSAVELSAAANAANEEAAAVWGQYRQHLSQVLFEKHAREANLLYQHERELERLGSIACAWAFDLGRS